MANKDFGMEQVTEYLKLLDRRMYIVMHSGADWQPEYGQELEEIDKKISALRELMDSAPDQEDVPPCSQIHSRKGCKDITLCSRMKIVGNYSTVDIHGVRSDHELIRVCRLSLDGTPYAAAILYSTDTRTFFVDCLYGGHANWDYRLRRPFADDFELALSRAKYYLRKMQQYV